MSEHNADIRLRHMLDYAREAVALSRGQSRAELDSDRLLNLALVQVEDLPPLIAALEKIVPPEMPEQP